MAENNPTPPLWQFFMPQYNRQGAIPENVLPPADRIASLFSPATQIALQMAEANRQRAEAEAKMQFQRDLTQADMIQRQKQFEEEEKMKIAKDKTEAKIAAKVARQKDIQQVIDAVDVLVLNKDTRETGKKATKGKGWDKIVDREWTSPYTNEDVKNDYNVFVEKGIMGNTAADLDSDPTFSKIKTAISSTAGELGLQFVASLNPQTALSADPSKVQETIANISSFAAMLKNWRDNADISKVDANKLQWVDQTLQRLNLATDFLNEVADLTKANSTQYLTTDSMGRQAIASRIEASKSSIINTVGSLLSSLKDENDPHYKQLKTAYDRYKDADRKFAAVSGLTNDAMFKSDEEKFAYIGQEFKGDNTLVKLGAKYIAAKDNTEEKQKIYQQMIDELVKRKAASFGIMVGIAPTMLMGQ